MPSLKCPQCARELAADAEVCPFDGTRINFVGQASQWNDETLERQAPVLPSVMTILDHPVAREALSLGQKLGDYVVGSLLGAGGMGEVYAGEQPMIGKKVAIKVLKGEFAADPVNVARMLSEARAVNSIRHRSIVDIFNFGTLADGRPYLVMEYLEGTALDTMLRKHGALIPAEAAEFLEETCSALAAAHARGIVHRDLKPGNVFIVSDGDTRNRYVKLLDFGLAKADSTGSEPNRKTQPGMVVGTPDYIAPEQARGGTITARTDLYSLGVMAYEMLTGVLPFAAESVVELMMMHVQAPAPRVKAKVGFCPASLDALVFQLMAKAPEDRPRSADVVRQELVRIRREMREGATMTGSSFPPAVSKETIKIPSPEKATPKAMPFAEGGDDTAESIPRPRMPAPRLVGPPTLDSTERFAAVEARDPSRSNKRLGVILSLLAVLGAGGVALYTQLPDDTAVLPLSPTEDPPPLPPLPPLPPEPPVMTVPTPPTVPVPIPPIAAAPEPPPRTPKPRPPPRPPIAVGPSKEDLRAQLVQLLNRLERVDKLGPSILKTVNDTWTGRINEANTPEARKKIRSDMANTP